MSVALLRLTTIAMGAMCLSMGAPLAQDKPAFEGQTLKIATYGGAMTTIIRDAVTKPFELRTGARLQWSAGAPQDFMAQLVGAKGGAAPYDVVFLEDINIQEAADLDVVQKLDFSKIPNAKLLPPRALPAGGYSAAWGYFRLGIAYLPDKLKAAGIAPPKDLSIIFEPRLAGHLALPDVTQANWPNYMPTIAAYLGNSLSDPKPTIEKLANIKGVSLYNSSSDLEARMTSGDIWVSLWIDGRVNGLKTKGAPIEFAPLGVNDGKGGTFDYTAVLGLLTVASLDKKPLAEAFIDTMLSTPVASQIAINSTYAPGNIEAQKAVNADPKVGPLVDTHIEKQFLPDFVTWHKVQDKWIDAWGKAFRR